MKGIVHRGLLAVAPVLLGIGCRAERLTQPPSGSVVSSATIGPAAGAQPQGLTITEYPVPSGLPQFITAGPDGNLWFTELFSRIGRITTSGVITEFPVPTAGNPNGITAGPDGNLWFADYGADKIGKITTSGVITEFSVPTPGNPYGITAGPDGNLWFTEFTGHNIGKITTSGVITEFSPPQTNSYTFGITAGPDGNLWFTEAITIVGNPNTYVSKIGRITTSGVITEFLLPTGADGDPFGITAGPDGNLWFTEQTGNKIGKITTSGVITEFPVPTVGSRPFWITAGPDGNLWFMEYVGNKIGEITTSGVITEFLVPTVGSNPVAITVGPDGNLWFTEAAGSKIGRITLSPQTPPLAIVPPPAVTVATDVGRCDAQVNLGTPTTAGGTAPITLAATPAAGPYLLGTTTVTWTATDASGTTASATQFVTVRDQELPSVVTPPNVSTVTDPGKPTASVSPGVATATDNCPGVTVTGARNDGQALNAPYPVGQTIITWTATDASANKANASQSVTVADQQPPTLGVPADFAVNATSQAGAVVTYEAIASDNVAVASLTCNPASGTTFPIGTTSVTCVASDPSGNRASATFHVTVRSAQAQISDLETSVTNLALSTGTTTSLLAKLNDAVAAANAGDVARACTSLQDFINETQAQAGKKISISDANTLSAAAQRMRAVLGC